MDTSTTTKYAKYNMKTLAQLPIYMDLPTLDVIQANESAQTAMIALEQFCDGLWYAYIGSETHGPWPSVDDAYKSLKALCNKQTRIFPCYVCAWKEREPVRETAASPEPAQDMSRDTLLTKLWLQLERLLL